MEEERERKLFSIDELIDEYAEATSARWQLQEFRKIKKALLMKKAEQAGFKSAVLQQREAYADPEYREVIDAAAEAMRREAKAKWLLLKEEREFERWRTLQANDRAKLSRYT